MLTVRRLATGLLLSALATVCHASELQAFTTDGCSRFPDRSRNGKPDWCHCCAAHDVAYWRGGSAEERLAADRELKACVQKASQDDGLAALMYVGVRAGGGPYYNTSYRWGYGWPFGRNYTPLSADEQVLAAQLEHQYRLVNPTLACPAQTVRDTDAKVP